jgi:exonuclease V gamma subunit
VCQRPLPLAGRPCCRGGRCSGESTGEDNAWDRGRLLWTLLDVFDVFDQYSHEPWAAALGARRLTAAQHLAALFDSYGAHRPAMLRAWTDGDDTDGAGVRLSDDLAWQAQLWRRLRNGSVRRARPSGCLMRAPPSASGRARSTCPTGCHSSARPG